MKHFSIDELCRSNTATARKIKNVPDAKIIAALTALVDNILDPLREAWGKPINVNSGYRCPTLNKAIGGVATSQHMSGEAADITAGSPSENKKLFELAIKLKLPFDQLIDEKGYTWLHVSYGSCNRRAVLHLK